VVVAWHRRAAQTGARLRLVWAELSTPRPVQNHSRKGSGILDFNVAGEAVYPVARELKRRHIPFVFSNG